MKKDFLIRFSAVPLALLTLASIVFAVINFQKESQYLIPYDGVWWMEDGGTIQAQRLAPGGPGEQAGIKPGDKLLAVNEHPVHSVAGLRRHLDKTGYGVWSKPTYQLDRHGVKVQVPVILGQVDKSLNFPLRLIALVYLGIGFYVLFGCAVTVSVQLVGLFLVFTTLVVPALATFYSRRLRLIKAYTLGALGYAAGLVVSVVTDLPSGARIVCAIVVVGILMALVTAPRNAM